jgi:hypothetical protein
MKINAKSLEKREERQNSFAHSHSLTEHEEERKITSNWNGEYINTSAVSNSIHSPLDKIMTNCNCNLVQLTDEQKEQSVKKN